MNQVRLAAEAMRTRFEIVLADERRSEADLRAAGEEALAEIVRWEGLLSAHRPGADLQRLNQHGAEGPQRVDARLMAFLTRALSLSQATEGAFDPTVGPLLRLWDIGGDSGSAKQSTPDSLAEARDLVGMTAHVRLDSEQGTAEFDRPGVRLDPGALGKGWALDQAVALLRELGIENALLHGGTSSVYGIGNDPATGSPWQVAIRHPVEGRPHICRVGLADRGLSISAAIGGTGCAHVMDPGTGFPVSGSILAAATSVSATDVEALSTVLLVQGEAGIAPLSRRFPDAKLLLIAGEDSAPDVVSVGQGWQWMTSSR